MRGFFPFACRFGLLLCRIVGRYGLLFPHLLFLGSLLPRCLFACKLRLTLLSRRRSALAGATIRLGLALLFGNEGGYTAVERVGLLLLGRKM